MYKMEEDIAGTWNMEENLSQLWIDMRGFHILKLISDFVFSD